VPAPCPARRARARRDRQRNQRRQRRARARRCEAQEPSRGRPALHSPSSTSTTFAASTPRCGSPKHGSPRPSRRRAPRSPSSSEWDRSSRRCSSATPATSPALAVVITSPPTRAPRRSRCPPEGGSSTDCRDAATGSSTTLSTSPPSPRSASRTRRVARCSSARSPKARPRKKPSAPSSGASPTLSTDSSSSTPAHSQAREGNGEQLCNPAWPARHPNGRLFGSATPGPEPTLEAAAPLDDADVLPDPNAEHESALTTKRNSFWAAAPKLARRRYVRLSDVRRDPARITQAVRYARDADMMWTGDVVTAALGFAACRCLPASRSHVAWAVSIMSGCEVWA
jgi:hypothetical protein